MSTLANVEGLPMSDQTYNFKSPLSDHMIAFTALMMLATKSQKHRKPTPRLLFWRTILVNRMISCRAAAKKLNTGYRGYVGSKAVILAGRHRRARPSSSLAAT